MLSILFYLLTVISTPTKGGALAAGGTYYACMGACTSGAAAGGLMAFVSTFGIAAPASASLALYGAAACATVCSSLAAGTPFLIPGLCFADDSTFTTLMTDGQEVDLPVQDLSVGMSVKTYENGVTNWTKIVVNERKTGEFAHRMMTVAVDNDILKLTVTENHLMIAADFSLEDNQKTTEKMFGIVEAIDVTVGNLVPVIRDGLLVSGKVLSNEQEKRAALNYMGTAAGTAIANGLLTTTICDGMENVDRRAASERYPGLLQSWKAKHASLAAVY